MEVILESSAVKVLMLVKMFFSCFYFDFREFISVFFLDWLIIRNFYIHLQPINDYLPTHRFVINLSVKGYWGK